MPPGWEEGCRVRRCVLFRSRVDLAAETQTQLPAPLAMLLQRIRSGDEAVPDPLFVAAATGKLAVLEVAFVRVARRARSRQERRPELADVVRNHDAFPVVVRPVLPGSRGKHQPWFLLCSLFGCDRHDAALFPGCCCASSQPPSLGVQQLFVAPAEALVAPPRAVVKPAKKIKKQVAVPRGKALRIAPVVMPASLPVTTKAPAITPPSLFTTTTTATTTTTPVAPPTKKTVGVVPVDSNCKLDEACVFVENGLVWSCTLNQTNIMSNNNKFYVIQLLERKGAFILWTRWGRVGEVGQSATLLCGANLTKAKAAFEKKFLDKTGNYWKMREHFAPRPGKYTWLRMDDGSEEEPAPSPSASAVAVSSLPEPVQRVTALIFDVKMMERQMTELEFDVKKQPLGKLSRSQISAGHKILCDLEKLIVQQGGPRTLDTAAITDLSSRFYTLIPHDFGRQRPPLINSIETLRKKVKMLEALADVEVATSILKDSASLDEHYQRLNTTLEVVAAGSSDDTLVRRFVHTTHPQRHPAIKAIFRIERNGEAARFEPTKALGNRMLLWHGSRLSNFASIISQGLRIAPPEAPVTGYRFGKGIYFADLCSVSSMYCHAQPGDEFLMLLAEVSLGTVAELDHDQYMEQPLPGTDSTKALGKTIPDPSEFITLDDGVVVPCGHPIPAPRQYVSCTENEYVVYAENRVHLRFMVHLVYQ